MVKHLEDNQTINFHSSISAEVDDEIISVICNLVHTIQPKLIVESGTYLGKSARAMAKELNSGNLITCDPCDICWKSDRGFEGLPIEAHHCKGVDFKPKSEINLLFIDSGTNSRSDEVEYFVPFMSKKSIILIDDPGCFDYSVLGTMELKYITLPVKHGLIMVQVN